MECIYQEIECPKSENVERTGYLNCKGCPVFNMSCTRGCPTSKIELEEDYNLDPD